MNCQVGLLFPFRKYHLRYIIRCLVLKCLNIGTTHWLNSNTKSAEKTFRRKSVLLLSGLDSIREDNTVLWNNCGCGCLKATSPAL